MEKNSLETYRQLLTGLRSKITGSFEKTIESSKEEYGTDVPDVNDEATRTMQRRILLEYGDRQHEMITSIDEALERIEAGEYGECQECGDNIPEKRLELIPYASYCVRCKERLEREEKENG